MTTSKSIPTTTVSKHSVSNRFVTQELIRSTTHFINGSATTDDWRQFLWKFGFQIFCAILLLFITIVFFMYGMIVFNRIRRDHRSRSRSRSKSKLRSKPSVTKGDKTKKTSKHRRHSRTRTLESTTVSTTRTANNRHKDKKHRDVSTTISGHSAKAHHNHTPHNHNHKGHNNKRDRNKPERVQTDLSVLDDMSRADAQISNSINYSKHYSSSSAIDNSQSVISAYSPENDPSVLKRKPKTKTPEITHLQPNQYQNKQQQKPKTKRSKIRIVKTKDPLITETWKNNGRNKHSKMRKKTVSLSPNESKTTISNSTNFSNVFTSIKKN